MTEAAIFSAALEKQSPEERAAYLSEACAGDHRLRRRVEAMLKAHAEPDDFLDGPASRKQNTTVHFSAVSEQVGVKIGPYRLMEQIGEGGFGLVFVAEQKEPVRRKVALKVIKPGMDTREVMARFAAERQALALMDHPNIAKVLDAGATESGRPYFVLELVRGIPINEYCDKNHLGLRERLELFLNVCHAIQHAHQKGIIHRDIKPSNVLVTSHDGKPAAKVIDFGVAKAIHQQLTDRTVYTQFAQMVGTPLYMSPEQAEMSGLDIDTRSDIYSLGVLLYELLTGTTPLEKKRFAKAAYDEIRRLIREEEPQKPSTRLSTSDSIASIAAQRHTEPAKLSRSMRGDLDWITMKALEKDRTRRYESAGGFAADVQRYLDGEAVQAHPPSTAYRMRKFIRRHKLQVMAASLVLFALLAGMAGTTWGLIKARQQELIAREETAEKEKALRTVSERAEGERQAKQEAEAKGAEAKRQEAEAKKQEAEAKRQEAEAKRQEAEARKKLVRFRVATGTNAADRGELWEALVWYAKAWEDDSDRQNESSHRLRIAWTLHRAPKLAGAFFHDMMVYDALLSPDGSRVITITEGGVEARLHDTATQSVLVRMTPGGKVLAAAFSPDGKTFATGSGDGVVRFWKSVDGAAAAEPLDLGSPVHRLAFHPSQPIIAAATEKTAVILYDVAQRKRIELAEPLDVAGAAAVRGGNSGGSKKAKRYITFSGDGSRVLGAAEDSFRVWDAETGKSISPILNCRGMLSNDIRQKNGPGISPDGSRTIGVGNKGLVVIDVATGKTICPLSGSALSPVFQSEFSPDGKRVLTVTSLGNGLALVHDSQTGAILKSLKHPRSVLAAIWSPDGKQILSASAGGEVHLWDAETAQELAPVNKHGVSTSRLAFSADGKQALVADLDGTVRLWEYSSPTHLTPYDIAEGRNPWDGNASPDGRFILMKGAAENERVLGSAQTGKALNHPPFEIINPAATIFSANGEHVLLVNAEGMGQVYHTDTGRAAGPASRPITESWVGCAALNPDGTLWAIGGSGGRAETYDTSTGRKLATVRHNYNVTAVAFDATGQQLATCSLDRNARVWDAKSGAPVSPQLHHAGYVTGASFSPDGHWLVTTSGGRTLQLWDVRTGDPLGPPLISKANVANPWFGRDGRSIIFRGPDKHYRYQLPLFTAPAGEVPLLARLYSGWCVDETDGLSTILKSEFINNCQQYRQAWFASLSKDVPAVPESQDASKAATRLDTSSIVSLEVARQSIGKHVTVEFVVENMGRTNSGGWLMLNSKKDYEAKDNFNVAIRNGVGREGEFGLKQDVIGKTVRVAGTVTLYKGRPQIEVDSKSQLEILSNSASTTAASTATAAAKPTHNEAVSPEIARQSIGKSLTVEFAVENVGRPNSGNWVFLNSKKDFKSKDNFVVAIRNGAKREEEFGLKQELVGKRIRATGTVVQFQGKTQIVVEKKADFEVLLPSTAENDR
jgi:WD40 repeat protein/serine/threonine protein kinase/DNA/RNA endonuclease YhcR with UshA esterase domain